MDNKCAQIKQSGSKRNGFALASISFAIAGIPLSICGVLGVNISLLLEVIGLISGIIALVQIRYSARQITGEKLAINGIWISVYCSILPAALILLHK